MGKGIFDWPQWYYGAIDAIPRADDLWWGNTHTDYIYSSYSIMASNTVDLIYNPLIDYIRSHVYTHLLSSIT